MSILSNYRNAVEIPVPSNMQAVVLAGRGFENLAVKEVPVPDVRSNQILARVDAAGVCTSIIKLVAQGEDHPYINGWDMASWPVILGDEGSVTLVKIGENLKAKYRCGQRFAVQPAVNADPICNRERYRDNAAGMHKCAVGHTLPGHLAQYMLIQEEVLKGNCLLPLPDDGMPYFAVSMSEPVSCIFSAQERNYHLIKDGPFSSRKPVLGMLHGGVTVVIGAGAMGRIHVELALRAVPSVIVVADLQQERLDRTVKTLGPKAQAKGVKLVCVTPDKLHNTVRIVSNGKGADDVILAVGIRPVQQDALQLLGHGGVANLFGGLPKGQHMLELDALAVHYREIKVVGSSGGDPSDMVASLNAIASGVLDAGSYVAAVGSLDNAIKVLNMIKEGKMDGKAILYPHIKSMPLQPVEYWSSKMEDNLLNEHLE
ncbi:MAG: zinc-binding dehydrogenase [Kiritimatiellae bacterium]|nr:zinc-binding dehydrogenase [Kiritimatiellia bacterium]MDD5521179.1 zinc-binding dehydrogenase [Kiritimatiellia bacterium]